MRRADAPRWWWLTGVVAGLLLAALQGAGPVRAQAAGEIAEAGAAVAGDEDGRDQGESGQDVEAGPLERYPERTFRLYARRDVSLRLRPEAGLRPPPIEPAFSPLTPDFVGRERHTGPLFAASASLSLLSVNGERDSAKGQEFRDLTDGGVLGVDAWYRGDAAWMRLTGRHLGLDDADLDLELRGFGLATARLLYSEIPHNYAFAVPSLYSGAGTGLLRIDDDIQATLQDSTSLVDAAERLEGLLADRASPVDLRHVRERFGLELDVHAFDPLAIEVDVRDESRQGTRPWSASFGLASVVEIPWPVRYDSEDRRVTLEWARSSTLVRASYRDARFENDVSDVVFDNPWRITDSTGSIFQGIAVGPVAGLVDLYPDNRQQEQTLTAVRRNLPGESTLAATVSWGLLEQDDPLVPYTTNTAIASRAPFDPADPANRPATSAAAELETRLVHLRFTARPVDFFEIEAQVRDYELDNETRRISTPGMVLEDTLWSPFPGSPDGAFTNLPIAYGTTSLELELGFDVAKRTQLTLSFENEEWDREFREVEETDEDRFEVALDTKPAAWVDLRGSYLHWERRAVDYDFDQFYTNQGIEFLPVLPFLLKFDQASRDRDRLQLMASFFPTPSLVVGAHLIHGSDDYPESVFGVQSDEHDVAAADLSYVFGERATLFASYTFERYELGMQGREWTAGGPGDPYRVEPELESASNWTASTRDDLDTVTLGLDLRLVPDRVGFDIAYSYSKSDGEIDYESPLGELDANPFEPADFADVDDVRFYSFNPKLEITLGEWASIVLGYLRERYELSDFAVEGLRLVPTTPSGEYNGALLMGSFPFDFDIEAVYVELELDL
jgi:MtrB/PioB family decaheme-associated outer membrane protein